MYSTLGEAYPWASPQAISNLTLPQLMMYLSEQDEKLEFSSAKEAFEYREKMIDEGVIDGS